MSIIGFVGHTGDAAASSASHNGPSGVDAEQRAQGHVQDLQRVVISAIARAVAHRLCSRLERRCALALPTKGSFWMRSAAGLESSQTNGSIPEGLTVWRRMATPPKISEDSRSPVPSIAAACRGARVLCPTHPPAKARPVRSTGTASPRRASDACNPRFGVSGNSQRARYCVTRSTLREKARA